MQKTLVFLLALTILMGFGFSIACAEPYISGNLGVVFVEDSNIENDFSNVADVSFDAGFGITAAAGNTYDTGFRAEVEFGYRSKEIDEFDSEYKHGSLDGDISALSMMINGFYDIKPEERFCPFIGVGIGIADIEGDLDEFGSEDEVVFAYQLAAGVAFAVDQNTKLDVQYRYFSTNDPDFNGLNVEYDTHNAVLGLRYSF